MEHKQVESQHQAQPSEEGALTEGVAGVWLQVHLEDGGRNTSPAGRCGENLLLKRSEGDFSDFFALISVQSRAVLLV